MVSMQGLVKRLRRNHRPFFRWPDGRTRKGTKTLRDTKGVEGGGGQPRKARNDFVSAEGGFRVFSGEGPRCAGYRFSCNPFRGRTPPRNGMRIRCVIILAARRRRGKGNSERRGSRYRSAEWAGLRVLHSPFADGGGGSLPLKARKRPSADTERHGNGARCRVLRVSARSLVGRFR